MTINEVIESLNAAYNDWNLLLVNPQYYRFNNIISWKKSGIRLSDKKISYSDLINLSENKEYTFQVNLDGSLIQIFYEYDSSSFELACARLAYYSAKDESFISWVRMDYTPTDNKGVLHSACHIHISGFENGRLAVSGVPTPRQFIEFLIALCYPEEYQLKRLDNQGKHKNLQDAHEINLPRFSHREPELEKIMTLIKIPTNYVNIDYR